MELFHRKGIHLIPVCPEQMGGLATPRAAAEIQEDGSVVTKDGKDVTREYCRGAEEVLKIARLYQCDMAIMKERSPSCGYGRVYDGTFLGTLKDGDGIASGVLMEHGIDVFGESELDRLLEILENKYFCQHGVLEHPLDSNDIQCTDDGTYIGVDGCKGLSCF